MPSGRPDNSMLSVMRIQWLGEDLYAMPTIRGCKCMESAIMEKYGGDGSVMRPGHINELLHSMAYWNGQTHLEVQVHDDAVGSWH